MDAGNIVVAANVAAATSAAFELSGETKIIAYPLAVGNAEYVQLLEEEPGGTYVPVVNKDGVGVFLTNSQPSQIIVGYGSYKLSKTATASAVAAAVILV